MSRIKVFKEGESNSTRLMGQAQFEGYAKKKGWKEVPSTGVPSGSSIKEVKMPSTESKPNGESGIINDMTKEVFIEAHHTTAIAELKRLKKLGKIDELKALADGDERPSVIKAVERFTK